MYLYNVNTIRLLLLTALLCCATLRAETFAVIVSGGRSKMFNHERYWNDCAFLYRTLRHDCHIDKDRITLLMADGDDAANDMLREGGIGFASTPTDLDGDGVPDLHLAATRQNLEATFSQLSYHLTGSDHLLVFVTDHGERSSQDDVCLWLWGEEPLCPDELADILGQCSPATMSIVLGQCYAGAFVAPLMGEGRIIIAACSASQLSWACKDRPYDEFVYHWTCAIAQHDEQGRPVRADADGDGSISMAEAFNYALQHDSRPESPSLNAQPNGLPAQWSLCGKLSAFQGTITPTTPSRLPTIYDLQGRKVRQKNTLNTK